MPRPCPCKRHSLKRTAINQKARRAGLSHNGHRFSTDAIPHLLFGARVERGERRVFFWSGEGIVAT